MTEDGVTIREVFNAEWTAQVMNGNLTSAANALPVPYGAADHLCTGDDRSG
jgi:hypothetical protein